MSKVVDFYFRVNGILYRVNNYDLLIDPYKPFSIMEPKRIYVEGLGMLEMEHCNISVLIDYLDDDEVLGYYHVYDMTIEGGLC